MTQPPLGWLTWRDADAAVLEFIERLQKKEFATTCCEKCQTCFFPPQSFCPYCFSDDITWKQLSGKGKLYTFTQIDRSFRFTAPDVVGLVEVDGVAGRVFSRIDATFDRLEIGMDVYVDFVEVGEGYFLHQFRPLR